MATAFGGRAQIRRRPKDPEALALGILALRTFATNARGSDFEQRANDKLASLKVDRAAVAKIVDRFDNIRPSVKSELLREFAPLADRPPDRLRLRDERSLAPVRGMTKPAVFGRILDQTRAAMLERPDAGASSGQPRPEAVEGPSPVAGLPREDATAGTQDRLDDPNHPFVPVYTIRYKGLQCLDESDWDRWTTSDEIYIVTSALEIDAGGANVLRNERHPVREGQKYYGNVDTGDHENGPVAACWRGATDVVSLTVAVFENDDGDPDKYKTEVGILVAAAATVVAILFPVTAPYLVGGAIAALATDFLNSLLGSGDDLIEALTEVITQEDLEQFSLTRALDHKGDGIKYHFVTDHQGGGAQYLVAFDVQRRPAHDIPDIQVE